MPGVNSPQGGAGIDPRSLSREAYALASAASDLRCPLSGSLLDDPVLMPCCGEAVQRTAVQARLPMLGFVCPLCRTPDVSPDALAPFAGMRRRVERHVADAGARWSAAAAAGGRAGDAVAGAGTTSGSVAAVGAAVPGNSDAGGVGTLT